MAAVIFNGNFVKTLKDNIKVGNAENIYLLTGNSDDPTSVAKDAPEGSIFWRFGTSEIYQKLDNGSSTNWSRMDGDIKGPGSSTDNAITRWDGTSGLAVQDSGVIIDDSNNITGINDLSVGNNITVTGTVDGRDVSTDGSTLDSHLDGGVNKHDASEIDVEGSYNIITGSDAETAFSELDSSLSGHLDGGANKHDADEIDYERADGSKKNIQAASDEVESALSDLDDAIGTLIQGTDYTASNAAIVSSHLQAIDSAIGGVTNLINNFEWQNSALDYITDNTAAPPTEVSGDRYVLSDDGGAPNAAWDGASAGDIVEFNGTTWDSTTPSIGMIISVDDESTSLRQWGGTSWTQKFFESTTASGFLSTSAFDVQLTNLSDGNLIVGNSSNVATSVDTASIGDIDADTVAGLTIKSNIIDNDNINSAAAIEFTKLQALTANRAIQTSGSGFLEVSTVTNTELGFLSGVTSALQTQLDAKLDDFTSTTDNALVRSDGATGEAVQDSGVLLDDTDAMTGLQSLTFNSGVLISSFLDEDDLVSDSNTAVPTQQSVKAYVDSSVAAGVFDVNSISTNTNAAANDTYLVDVSGGAVEVTLPSPALNSFVRIKDSSGDANTNNITVSPNAAETIDGAASFTIDSNYGSNVFVSDGTNWFVL